MTRVESLPTDQPLMVICHMGGRSAAVAGFLIRTGRTDVVNVAGGMEAWERAGLPVRRGDGRTRRRGPARADLSGGVRSVEDCGAMMRPRLRLVRVCPADQHQDDEVHGADAGRVQVAELLADLASILSPGTVAPTRPSWKNGLCGAVFARTLDADGSAVRSSRRRGWRPVRRSPAGAPSSAAAGRSLTGRCFHSGRSPAVVGTAQ